MAAIRPMVFSSSSTDGLTWVYSRSRAMTRTSRKIRKSLKIRRIRSSLFRRAEPYWPLATLDALEVVKLDMRASVGKLATRSIQNHSLK